MSDQPPSSPITSKTVAESARLIGLDFTDAECEMMVDGLRAGQSMFEQLRTMPLPNHVPLALSPNLAPAAEPVEPDNLSQSSIRITDIPGLQRPDNLEEVAFYPVTHLAQLIRTRQVTSLELTRMYLARLKRYDSQLQCVVTLIEERALTQARRADEEIARGHYRGPLHGIPWGVKDVFATRGVRTTWGAAPYKEQVIDHDATVVQRLEAAGSVLIAKLTTGILASDDDYWFGGQTKNPWDTNEGSSGSSAGPGAATAAGLVGYAVGTETQGSIVAPSARCGITGFRPTYGRVSRHGVMALSWTLDTVGPMCRAAEDCALVFQAICGPDGHDATVVDRPFHWASQPDMSGLRIGYVEQAFADPCEHQAAHDETLAVLKSLGAEVVPIQLPDYPDDALRMIVFAEAAAAFDELTRSKRDRLLTRQGPWDMPNAFRMARLIPAVEYLQANRIRSQLIEAMRAVMADVDIYLHPNVAGKERRLSNYTGYPVVAVPNGFSEAGKPVSSMIFVGQHYGEAQLLTVAKAYQDATDFHQRHPPLRF